MTGLPPPNVLSYEGQVVVPFINRTFPPTSSNYQFTVPTIWMDTAAHIPYILVAKPMNVADWLPFGSDVAIEYVCDVGSATPAAGILNVLGLSGVSTAGSGNTINISSAASSTTYTANSGSATPSLDNLNILGSGSITTTGSGSTITAALIGLTNHNVLIGAGTDTITKVAPSATSGVPLVSAGAAADPIFGTAVVAGGGTGATTLTAHSLLLGQGTSPITALGVATNGQLPIGSTGVDPVLATLTAGAGISITNGAGSITITNTGTLTSANYTSVNSAASPYTVLVTDYYISVDTSGGAVTLRFPNAPTFKQTWVVKDRTGNAAANNITITTPGGTVTFDGSTSYVINTSYEAINILANSTPAYEIY